MTGRLKILLIVFAVLIIIIGVWFYISPPFGGAAPLQPDPSRLSLFIYPDQVVADGKDEAKVIAVVKDRQNPVPGAQVFFKNTLGNLSAVEASADVNGQAVVYISSEEAGEAIITAVSGTMSKKETITFSSIK